MKLIVYLVCIVCLFPFLTEFVFATTSYKPNIGGTTSRNGIIYTFGISECFVDGVDNKTMVGFIAELRYINGELTETKRTILPDYYPEQLILDDSLNKYMIVSIINKEREYTFVDSDKRRKTDDFTTNAICKLSADYSTEEFCTIIPNLLFNRAIIALDSKKSIYYAHSTWPVMEPFKSGDSPLLHDSLYYISDDAIQKKQRYIDSASVFEMSAEIYIAKLSNDGKNITKATFVGSDARDALMKMLIDSNDKIILLTAQVNGPKYGNVPITQNAFQKVLPQEFYDSLAVEEPRSKYWFASKLIPPTVIYMINTELNEVEYCSYYSYGKITDACLDKDNLLYICGWNRENSADIPAGSFVGRLNKSKSAFDCFYSMCPTDIIDTLSFSYSWNKYIDGITVGDVEYQQKTRYYYLGATKDGIFVAGTTDGVHPVANGYEFFPAGRSDLIGYSLNFDLTNPKANYYGAGGAEECEGIITLENEGSTDLFVLGNYTTYNMFGVYLPFVGSKQFISGNPVVTSIVDDANYVQNSISIFPNPANESLYVNSSELDNTNKIEIFDALGIMVLECVPASKINISALPSGIYTLKYGNSQKNFVKI